MNESAPTAALHVVNGWGFGPAEFTGGAMDGLGATIVYFQVVEPNSGTEVLLPLAFPGDYLEQLRDSLAVTGTPGRLSRWLKRAGGRISEA